MQPKAEEAVFTFNWLSATGTSLLLQWHRFWFIAGAQATKSPKNFLGNA